MFKKLFLLLIISPIFIFCQSSLRGNSITGKFSPAKNYEFGILYRLTPTGKVYAKDTKVDANGNFKLALDSTTAKGNYRLVYNLPEEENYFDLIYDGKEEVSFQFSKDSGVIFEDAQNKMLAEYLRDIKEVETQVDSQLASKNPNRTEVEKLFKKQAEIQNKAEKEAENTYASIFIKAHKPYIPTSFKNKNIYYGDKKTNFFENFNFEDTQLQSSPFPLERIEAYYDEFIGIQGGSFYRSIINDINFELRNADSDFQKTVLADFWQSLLDKKKNNAANYLAENYLIQLATAVNDTALSEKLNLFKNLSIGAQAPGFSWKDENKNENSLYETTGANYYVLAFWSSECSHCMEQMPVLHKKMTKLKTGKTKIIAIGLEIEDQPWKDTVKKMPNFIQVLKTDEERVAIANIYNVTATPTYYVLDKDKKIIGKPRGQKNLSDMIDTLEAYKK